MKTALVITHEKHEGPGQFGEILRARGFGIRVIFTPAESITDFDPLVPDFVLVMGGPMGVYEEDIYPFLKEEKDFLAKRIKADRPTLGVCLGAQIIAAALGEPVFKGRPGQEIGWNKLEIKNKNHPIRHLAGDKTNMFHWHGDTFDLPKGAELLASSNMYENQAFGVGRNVLALQCHPEITRALSVEWLDTMGAEVTRSKIVGDIEELKEQTDKNIDTMNTQAKLFFEEWLGSVGL
ncbi:MAG: glutamine amidotransferase [Alphaproteobacteria bacterium]